MSFSSVSIVRTSKQLFLFLTITNIIAQISAAYSNTRRRQIKTFYLAQFLNFHQSFCWVYLIFFLSALSDRTRVACHYNILNATSVRGLLDDYHCAPELNNRVSTLVVNCHPVHHSSGNTEGADDLSSFKFI